jgi:hypothetical protein
LVRFLAVIAFATVLAADKAVAQPWSFSASAFTYFMPKDEDYVQPTVAADRGGLHLEARYNYEDRNTGSVWIGKNFSTGDSLVLEITPILGGVFGNTNGIAPGYEGSLSWKKFEIYSESEYLFDTDDIDDSYLFNWSELSLAPREWYRFGVVIQRSRTYEFGPDRDIQRGLLAGLSYSKVEMSAYVFNPDDDRPTVVVALGVTL